MPLANPVVFILHHDPAVRQALTILAQRAGWESTTLNSAEGFPLHARIPGPGVLLLETTGEDRAWELVQQRAGGNRTPLVLLADQLDITTVVKAMKAGVFQVFTPPFNEAEIAEAIQEGLDLSRLSLKRETELEMVRNAYASLSPRERQVMTLVASGYLNKQVGGRLGISEITVKAHRGRVMQKMSAASLPELVRMAAGLDLPVLLRHSRPMAETMV